MTTQKVAPHRALLIIDVEPRFVTPRTRKAIPAIARLIKRSRYGLYVIAEYTDRTPGKTATRKTAWERTFGSMHREEETVAEVAAALENKPLLRIVKTSRSLFGADQKLVRQLRRRGITEVHIVGLETHDCVLASAFDAFDYEFTTYVLTEYCASKRLSHHKAGCTILKSANIMR